MSLSDTYSQAELQAMLKEANDARHLIATQGGVQQIRVLDRVTQFHRPNLAMLDAHIAAIRSALGLTIPARSFDTYLG